MTGPAPAPGLDRDLTIASNEQLLRVVGLIDTLDRRGSMDRLLDPVRDRVALLRPPRPLALGRVLILPFEDLLVPDSEAWPGRRCLSRAHLGSLIELVSAGLSPATAAALKERAGAHTMMSGDVVREIGATLWPAAADILAARATSATEPSERDRQFAAVTPILALGATVVPTMWQLPPRPIASLARPALDLLLDLLRAAAQLGEEALLAVLELLLARVASPLVLLEPLRGAEFGLSLRGREALLGRIVHRRIADMREIAIRLAAPPERGRSDATGILRLVADLEALDGNWPVSPNDKAALAEIRRSVSAFVGSGIKAAVEHEILAQLEALSQPEGMSDDSVERLEETARHTRRLGIAGAKLGLAATPDSLLKPFLQPFQDAVHARRRSALDQPLAGLLEQVRVVEILFGADAAMRLYDELRGKRAGC